MLDTFIAETNSPLTHKLRRRAARTARPIYCIFHASVNTNSFKPGLAEENFVCIAKFCFPRPSEAWRKEPKQRRVSKPVPTKNTVDTVVWCLMYKLTH